MADPGIYVCVRRTLPWEDEELVRAHLRPEFRPKMEVWNATFDVPYHVFRHRLQQIAQTNLARVTNATCAPLEAVPRGAVVIPVDDDDWLAPDLADRLRDWYDPAIKGYLWIRRVVEPRVPLRRRLWYWLWSWKKSVCDTNNYALPKLPELVELVYHHVRAGRYFDANRAYIKRVPMVLSIQNRNMSSQTALAWRRPSITRSELVRSFRRYRTLYASVALPEELEWARPHIDQMAGLMQQLGLK